MMGRTKLPSRIYRHSNGSFLRLIRRRESGVNTFLEVDHENKPIIKHRKWATRPQQQTYLVRGFGELELLINQEHKTELTKKEPRTGWKDYSSPILTKFD